MVCFGLYYRIRFDQSSISLFLSTSQSRCSSCVLESRLAASVLLLCLSLQATMQKTVKMIPNTLSSISLVGAASATFRSPSTWSAISWVILPLRKMVNTGIILAQLVKSRSSWRQTLVCRQMVAVNVAPDFGQITISVSSYTEGSCWCLPDSSQTSTSVFHLGSASRKWLLLAKRGSPMKERFISAVYPWQKLAFYGLSLLDASIFFEIWYFNASKPNFLTVSTQVTSPTRYSESMQTYWLSLGVLMAFSCEASVPPSGAGLAKGLMNSVMTLYPSKQVWLYVMYSLPLTVRQTCTLQGSPQPVQADWGMAAAAYSIVEFGSFRAIMVYMDGSPPSIGSISFRVLRKGSQQPKRSSQADLFCVKPPNPTSMVTNRMQFMSRVLFSKQQSSQKKRGSSTRVRFCTIGPLKSLSQERRSLSRSVSLYSFLSIHASPQISCRT